MIPNTVCYSGVIGKDTAFLKTEIFPNVVTGNLLYKFHEKDNNKGDIDGILKNDTLVADYKFSSEGQPRCLAFYILAYFQQHHLNKISPIPNKLVCLLMN